MSPCVVSSAFIFIGPLCRDDANYCTRKSVTIKAASGVWSHVSARCTGAKIPQSTLDPQTQVERQHHLFRGVDFLAGSRCDAIRRDRLLPVRGNVFRIRTACGRAEARPDGKTLPVREHHIPMFHGQRHVKLIASRRPAPDQDGPALVGLSGAGKTTIARLIQRFWDDHTGGTVSALLEGPSEGA